MPGLRATTSASDRLVMMTTVPSRRRSKDILRSHCQPRGCWPATTVCRRQKHVRSSERPQTRATGNRFVASSINASPVSSQDSRRTDNYKCSAAGDPDQILNQPEHHRFRLVRPLAHLEDDAYLSFHDYIVYHGCRSVSYSCQEALRSIKAYKLCNSSSGSTKIDVIAFPLNPTLTLRLKPIKTRGVPPKSVPSVLYSTRKDAWFITRHSLLGTLRDLPTV